MKLMLSILVSLLSFFSLQAQTFVESFLKNKDSIAVYHNGKGQEMIPVVRFYLFADSLVPDTSGRIDADRLLSQWNHYILGKTTSLPSGYRRVDEPFHDLQALMMEDVELRSRMGLVDRYPKHCFDFLEPDLIVMPCMVCYAPEDATDSCPFDGLYKKKLNNHVKSKRLKFNRSKLKNCYPQERKVLCFDFCVEGNKWFLKGDTLYTGYVWDSLSNQVRLRTLQETLDDIQSIHAHYFNNIDSTCLIPTEKRKKIVRILDDEITWLDFVRWEMRTAIFGPSFESGFYTDWMGYTPVFPEKAYKERGEENQYHGPIEYLEFPTPKSGFPSSCVRRY